MSMVFCSSLMLEKSSNHSSSTRDLKIPLAFVMNKTPYSHFLLTVFTHLWNHIKITGGNYFWLVFGIWNHFAPHFSGANLICTDFLNFQNQVSRPWCKSSQSLKNGIRKKISWSVACDEFIIEIGINHLSSIYFELGVVL